MLKVQSIRLQPSETVVVGVGSVGRPYDGPNPSYVIYDEVARQVEMIRVYLVDPKSSLSSQGIPMPWPRQLRYFWPYLVE